MTPYNQLSDLTDLAVNHWVEHLPQKTKQLLWKKTFGEEIFSRAKTLQELIFRNPKGAARDAAWEELREQYLLLPEETLVEENPQRAKELKLEIEDLIEEQYPYNAQRGWINNALQVSGHLFAQKGLPLTWNPESSRP